MVGDITPREGGRLTGRTIAILMESDYVEPELHYYQRRFAEEGATTLYLTRLWGQPSITFHGHEFQLPFAVEGDLEAVDQETLESFDALIVPAGMVSDRLRYTDDPDVPSPAVRLLERAFATPGLLKGIICHGMWLAAPIPEVVRGRRLTCHNNLVSDVRNMGATYTDQDVVVDGDLVTARTADHCHLFAHTLIDLIEARSARRPSWAGAVGDRSASGAQASSSGSSSAVGGQDRSAPGAAVGTQTLEPAGPGLPSTGAGSDGSESSGYGSNGSGSNGSGPNGSGPNGSEPNGPGPDGTGSNGAPQVAGPESRQHTAGRDGAADLPQDGSDQSGELAGPEARADAAYRGEEVAPDGVPEPGAAGRPATGYQPDFSFSDLVAGYVQSYDRDERALTLRTSDDRELSLRLDEAVSAEFIRNLGDPYLDASSHLEDLLVAGRQLFAYGVFYPGTDGYVIEVKRLVFVGRGVDDHSFDAPGWWTDQLRELARFYRRAQFGDAAEGDELDFSTYRTVLRLGGDKATGQDIQETDTVSRMVYGMASAYMLTGEQAFLDVATWGAEFLREHMRFVDQDEDVVYWYHGIDVTGGSERKLFTSEFGDDYNAIPMYEQIYALAGLTQLYRVTGDPRLAEDIDGTMRLFQKFFRDEEQGGYFSHIDPILLSPHHESLGPNRARKNWNSVGDHAPAYLINLWLATGEQRHADMLEDTFDTIVTRFPDPDSPFVQERFHQDWSPDREWGWQQDRAVVGHNLKIAWNLMRMTSIRTKDGYQELAEELARRMPDLGSDRQRGGWYDVVERQRGEGEQWYRFVWHDRKAWWQQEQAILAYQILAGLTGAEDFHRHYWEAASFYNAFFLDHDEGGVYFNVLAAGQPYLVGTERLKGSHSMSMYHSAELCFLATVYGHLLLQDEPLTLWFRPEPGAFPDRTLRVSPDALPAGRVRLEWVEVDGKPYSAFDPSALTVKLPDVAGAVTVKAHLAPVRPE